MVPHEIWEAAKRTLAGHKGKRVVGISYECECGWRTGYWQGEGATRNAASDFRSHKEGILMRCREAGK